ncbi:hypothetical protein B4096_3670 [Heyndrickxia coagulans]|uniref:Uncharacterized protein n=1 Tax=Heyndrickxia coagulans TaxID=1398 RepID=A0A0C5CCL4_HEYCO|nr:hypothetical protein SB48_HM08orf03936 [Heyndrickxia coagulans]KWZ76229.1 hypothetical protein HMPREF3213_03982 [Heyndrickxia coagulans]KYC89728.1 hypothetical protein B4096_3670 [Heyndrickxia coagulans]
MIPGQAPPVYMHENPIMRFVPVRLKTRMVPSAACGKAAG